MTRLHSGLRIGLYGGSFNPAHAAHRHLAVTAMARLGLDQVWFLVSPQNPLKPARGMASFAERFASVSHVMRGDPRLRACDFEQRRGLQFTRDTVKAITAAHRGTHFVLLMGADNLGQLPRWAGWQQIFATLPIAVFARPSYSLRALSGKAARRYAARRVPEVRARMLATATPPAWTFVRMKLSSLSATAIREARARKPEETT
ncbi:nicotinate-nucleotide adenylyltransferase [Zavarzinia sp. CC-PAN008]|uniref:nicotinate-nucleotide adenylyltransferase n=1 Tax=Zavarzinia sp. CC-PAN008 TaxID=3243332 RepID=UPI003F742022